MSDPLTSERQSGASACLRRKHLLFVQREQPRGGAAAVAAWMMQALIPDYDITLLSWRRPDLRALDLFFGTSLHATELKVITISPWVRRIVELDPDPGSIQDWCVLLRRCKQIRRQYDLVLSAEMEADFGAPGIQYIHFPALTAFYPAQASAPTLRWRQKGTALVRGALRPWMVVADYSFERMRRNLTLVNSDWIGELVSQAYGIEAVTVYPPAAGEFPPIPWEQREECFCLH